MKIRHGAAIVFSGVIWMSVGIFLLTKGFSLLLHPTSGPVEQTSLALVALGILIGFLKGKFILAKTSARVIAKILQKPNPCSIFSVYSKGYLGLLLGMMAMGMALRWVSIPYEIKGVIDVAIGSALTNGSAYYFRHFAENKKKV